MAMTLASNRNVQASINMTPMIDVLLVLLIIFMAIAPTQSAGLSALVPESEKEANFSPPEAPVVLEIADDGSYRLNSQPLDKSKLGETLTGIFKTRGERVLFVKAAPALEFGVVAAAIDTAHDANISRVALMPR